MKYFAEQKKEKQNGFTLIEILIVMLIIGILVGLAIPQYKYSIIRSRETVLKQNLYQLRLIINQYYVDKSHYPETLQALVDEEYLHSIPIDPVTNSAETWEIIREEMDINEPYSGNMPGIKDVISGSTEKSLDGSLYNIW